MKFEPEAEITVRAQASALCDEFTEALPLVDRGTARHKVARLSAALAARTFSSDEEGALVVRPCHVEYVAGFLRRVYADPTFGYADLTQAMRKSESIDEPDTLRRQILAMRHPRALVQMLLSTDELTHQDFMDCCEVDPDAARAVVSLFVRHHAIRRRKAAAYGKAPALIQLLKEMEAAGVPEAQAGGTEF